MKDNTNDTGSDSPPNNSRVIQPIILVELQLSIANLEEIISLVVLGVTHSDNLPSASMLLTLHSLISTLAKVKQDLVERQAAADTKEVLEKMLKVKGDN